MPIDEPATSRLKLELPNETNTLKHDVARLINSFNALEKNAAVVDEKGIIKPEQYGDDVVRTHGGVISDGILPISVPLLDTNHKLPDNYIPDDARMNIVEAPSETMMLSITPPPTLGDICNITSFPNKQYILVKRDPTQADSWRELPAKAVTSVNGRVGDVRVAEAGVNNDITSLTALQGPLKLGSPGGQPSEAVTYSQLMAATATSSAGANLTGIMNDFLGAVEWFNGPRVGIPAGYVPADGQILKRADYPDLWAAVKAGMLNSVSQTNWDKKTTNTRGSFYYNRASYSQGDGTLTTGTTFRVPDLNGSQAGSITNTFLNGSTSTLEGNVGQVRESAAPKIIGAVTPTYSQTVTIWDGGTGAFDTTNPTVTSIFSFNKGADTVTARPGIMSFDASRSDKVYTGQAGELRPNCAVGIWIIRATGAFQAANTEFNVITSDANEPAKDFQVHGGIVKSRYNLKGKTRVAAAMYANFPWTHPAGEASNNIDIITYNEDGSVAANSTYLFYANGTFQTGNSVLIKHSANCSYQPFAGDESYQAMQLVAGTTLRWFQDSWQTGIRRTGGLETQDYLIYYNGGNGGGANAHAWQFSKNGDLSTEGAITLRGANLNGTNKEAARLTTYLNNDSAGRYFQFGLTQPNGGATYGQLFYGDSAKGHSWNFVEDGTFQSAGNIVAMSGGVYAQGQPLTSDRDLKDDIQEIVDPLQKLQALHGYTFSFKANGQKSAGIIAQEVQTVLPDIVRPHPVDGHLTVEYSGITGLLVEAVNALAAQVDDLKAQLAAKA